ncbi:glycosyltransferase family 2 protein [Ulvibacter antarcticus]|uniref:Glycosyltransferase 2-like domain-containing protein n=1 Tax=Ulvibacter antarcticus TaxID=442714 RepID=A0A3L9YES5_9FLAO|nr:glycosyltransferase [Ulvibacter antarcticus]RMA57977.1 hypothetical protein BXY75_2785 [Ulvibacter antarcticus]
MEKQVSIIIPCYNDAKYIEQAVASALGQTNVKVEVIVVDDGSNEETKAVLKKLEPKISKLITQTNQGQSSARNTGVETASADFLLMLDSDDYFEASFCEKALKEFQKSSEVKMVTCQANLINEDGSQQLFNPEGGTVVNFMFKNCALGTSMFRKVDWEACGGYDESMRKGFEDWEFFIRLLKNGGSATVIPEALYTYRKRSDSTTNRANKVRFDILKYIYLKHKDIYIENYEATISNFLRQNEMLQVSVKNKDITVDAKIGKLLLSPLRFFKKLFK